MALRDKLAERVQPYLEPGERIQSLFCAQSGPSPYWAFLSIWIMMFTNGYVIVVATDRAMIVLKAGRFTPTKPKSLRLRGPRNVWLGAPSGLWGQVNLDQRYWVHKRFHKDVVLADQALQSMYPGGQLPPAQY